jgi:hypothetical protein
MAHAEETRCERRNHTTRVDFSWKEHQLRRARNELDADVAGRLLS